jgi:hypothetical protein
MISSQHRFEASRMTVKIEIKQARTKDAREIADLHIVAIRSPRWRGQIPDDLSRL